VLRACVKNAAALNPLPLGPLDDLAQGTNWDPAVSSRPV